MKPGNLSFFTRKRSAVEERDYTRHAEVVRAAIPGAFRSLGWKARATQSGNFEATWSGSFGTEGSVVIRILTVKKATRVRAESVARQGGLDFGQNASKIREFFLKLDLSLSL